jgi:hypothetical protein
MPASAHRHPSVRALLALAQGRESAEEIMRRRCRAIVAYARTQGWEGPPFNPFYLASILGIVVEPTTEDIPGDGQIFGRRGQAVIQYRAGQMEERLHFTLCHEIAHTCFTDCFELPRFFGGGPDDKAYKEFENLCNVGASELLFPLQEFQGDLVLEKMRLGHGERLAKRYRASIDATLRRMIDLTEHSCTAAFLTDRAFKDFDAGRWRVRYSCGSPAFKGYIPPGTMAPARSRAVQAAPDEAIELRKCRETWWIKSKPRSFYVEALKLPAVENPDYPQFVALLHSRLP